MCVYLEVTCNRNTLNMRDRLRTAIIAEHLTLSKYLNMHMEEPIILHDCLEKHPYLHWVEHINSLPRHVNGESPTYDIRENFDELKFIIQQTLVSSNFIKQAQEIQVCSNEDELNDVIVRQYTEETGLYDFVNTKLRECHLCQGFDSKVVDNDDKFLAPWILQLSSCIKKLPHYMEKVYRGTNLKDDDIKQYKKGELFIWAPFVSASKNKEQCFGGNVLFEISSREHFFGLNDKAYPRDIANKSIFPEEAEVLFPISCAYRVENISNLTDYTLIELQTIDSY